MTNPRTHTYTERRTWGTCPVCGATQGERCVATDGEWFGWTRASGAHKRRLELAPVQVLDTVVAA